MPARFYESEGRGRAGGCASWWRQPRLFVINPSSAPPRPRADAGDCDLYLRRPRPGRDSRTATAMSWTNSLTRSRPTSLSSPAPPGTRARRRRDVANRAGASSDRQVLGAGPSAANLGGLTPPKLPVRYLDDQILEVPKSIRLATPHCTDGEATRAAGLEVFVREARGTEEKAPRDIRVASKGCRRPVLVRGRRERRVDAHTFAADTVALGRIEDRHQFVDGR